MINNLWHLKKSSLYFRGVAKEGSWQIHGLKKKTPKFTIWFQPHPCQINTQPLTYSLIKPQSYLTRAKKYPSEEKDAKDE